MMLLAAMRQEVGSLDKVFRVGVFGMVNAHQILPIIQRSSTAVWTFLSKYSAITGGTLDMPSG
jgi:hypothetical protein